MVSRKYRRVWIRARLRKNPKGCKKKYSRVKSHWRNIKLLSNLGKRRKCKNNQRK